MTEAEFCEGIEKALPGSHVELDSDGMYVIYTMYRPLPDGTVERVRPSHLRPVE